MEHQHPWRGCPLQAPDVYVSPEPFLLNTEFREYRLKGATNVEMEGLDIEKRPSNGSFWDPSNHKGAWKTPNSMEVSGKIIEFNGEFNGLR